MKARSRLIAREANEGIEEVLLEGLVLAEQKVERAVEAIEHNWRDVEQLTLALVTVISIGGSCNNVFASSDVPVQKVHVTTDRQNYYTGDVIVISGNVSRDISREGEPVVIQVFSPLGAMARADYVNVTSDGNFHYETRAGGTLMPIVGVYQVVATYAGKYQGNTSFTLISGSEDYLCVLLSCTYELIFQNSTYNINYRIAGVIQNISVDVDAKSLIVDAKVDARGSFLIIYLPRNLTDATELGEDGSTRNVNFTVFLNGLEVSSHELDPSIYLEREDNTIRLLRIENLTNGMNNLEIIGTWVVPEFGLPPVFVAVAASVGVMTLLHLRRTRNSQG